MTEETHRNLLAAAGAGPAPTELPVDPAAAELRGADRTRLVEVVTAHPESSLGWATLAEHALAGENPHANLTAYAYARTGYHRGLDALRRAGWRGSGPIPWEHGPNRGFLRALWALAVAAGRIGEGAEQQRCAQFLRDSSETAYQVLAEVEESQAPMGQGSVGQGSVGQGLSGGTRPRVG